MKKFVNSLDIDVYRSRYNGHPHRYPEEPSDEEVLPVGAEGNRNDVWYSEDGVEWLEVKATPWEKVSASLMLCCRPCISLYASIGKE